MSRMTFSGRYQTLDDLTLRSSEAVWRYDNRTWKTLVNNFDFLDLIEVDERWSETIACSWNEADSLQEF